MSTVRPTYGEKAYKFLFILPPWNRKAMLVNYTIVLHTDLSYYINSGIRHLPDGLDGFVQALYAIGGEPPQFLHPNSPYFAQDPK